MGFFYFRFMAVMLGGAFGFLCWFNTKEPGSEKIVGLVVIRICLLVVLPVAVFTCLRSFFQGQGFCSLDTIMHVLFFLISSRAFRMPEKLDDLLKEDDPYIQETRTVRGFTFVGPSNAVPTVYTERVTIPKPGYKSLEEKQEVFLRKAALMGLRGEYLMLLNAQARQHTGQEIRIQEQIDFHSAWYAIVEKFSARNLTHQHDRLPALCGVAERVDYAAIEPDVSLAGTFVKGLWKNSIVLDMLWSRVDGTLWTSDHRVQGMPTWSWTSIPAHVQTPLNGYSSTPKLNGTVVPFTVLVPTLPVVDETCINRARMRLSAQASELSLPVRGFVADDPRFDIQKHARFIWIPILARCSDPESRVVLDVHGLVLAEKDSEEGKLATMMDLQPIFTRVGYLWKERDCVDRLSLQEQSIIIE